MIRAFATSFAVWMLTASMMCAALAEFKLEDPIEPRVKCAKAKPSTTLTRRLLPS